MSDQPNEMFPRVTVRDDDDAMLIILALRDYMSGRIDELDARAKRPGANQYDLSMQMIKETEYITCLMRAVDAGIVRDPNTEETEDNGKEA